MTLYMVAKPSNSTSETSHAIVAVPPWAKETLPSNALHCLLRVLITFLVIFVCYVLLICPGCLLDSFFGGLREYIMLLTHTDFHRVTQMVSVETVKRYLISMNKFALQIV